jgi:hypothetical protein
MIRVNNSSVRLTRFEQQTTRQHGSGKSGFKPKWQLAYSLYERFEHLQILTQCCGHYLGLFLTG